MLCGLFRVCTVWPGVRGESVRQSPHSETLHSQDAAHREDVGQHRLQEVCSVTSHLRGSHLTMIDWVSTQTRSWRTHSQCPTSWRKTSPWRNLKKPSGRTSSSWNQAFSFQYFLDCLTILETATLPWINSEIFWSKLTVKYQRKSLKRSYLR